MKIENLKKKALAWGGLVAIDIPSIKPKYTTLDPKDAVKNIINYGLYFVGAIALIFIIYGGVKFITASGNPEKVTEARNILLYSILGIIVVVLAYAIINFAVSAPFLGS